MASISYTSFPPVADDPVSPSLISLDQLRMANNSYPVDGMKHVEISESGVEDEDTTSEFGSLDCAGYHHLVAPATPTKERSRRATMPETTKPRPQDVFPLPLSPSCLLDDEIHFPSSDLPSMLLIFISPKHDLNIDCS